MNAPRRKPHATTRVAALIIIVVVLVIATLLYNAIKGKRAYEEQNTSAFEMAAQTAVVSSEAAPRVAASR
jgi:Tfp pilus assembly protein PilX